MAEVLAELAGMRAEALPKRYPLDFALVDPAGEIRVLLEIKCRTNPRELYPTYMLSLAKYISMLSFQKETGLPCRLVVQWSDALGVLQIPAPSRITIGGRADRNDSQDREPVALFGVDLFRLIETSAARDY